MTAKLHDHLAYPPRAMKAERAARKQLAKNAMQRWEAADRKKIK